MDMKKIFKRYRKKVPEPLAAQFENRLGRKDAIKGQDKRKKMVTELFPAGKLHLLNMQKYV